MVGEACHYDQDALTMLFLFSFYLFTEPFAQSLPIDRSPVIDA